MLEHWIPSCRNRFNEADFEFVATALSGKGEIGHLSKLWKDPEGRREMLDLKEVFRSLLESPTAWAVSPRFYFYVLVRHAFLDAGLSDPDLPDYVAGVMAKRVCVQTEDPLQDVTRGYTHAAEFLSVISRSRGRMRFHLQLAAGNQFLVLAGLYPGFLKHRSERGESPGVEFYESFASQAYRGAAGCRMVAAPASRQVLGALADSMPVARRCLNRVAEEFVFLGE